ncbi:MAG: zinc dependent phospholipase C family protein [Phycisphaerae bacterium]
MLSKGTLPAVVAVGVYLLFDSRQALAWGPGIHIALASDVLSQAALLPASVAGILTRYALDYLYGNIAADLVFAKRLSRVKQFCHHWSTGFATLDHARDDRGLAFAYGYLSHLAADAVAHGKFVPHQIVVSGSTLNFGHLYWEMRADVTVGPAVWEEVDRVLLGAFHEHHRTLENLLTDTFLPFDANRQMFRGINSLVRRRSWRRTMASWERYSRHPLPEDLLENYLAEARANIIDLLTLMKDSPVLFEDPNGTASFSYVRAHRRQLRRLKRQGLSPQQRIVEAAASHAPVDRLDGHRSATARPRL